MFSHEIKIFAFTNEKIQSNITAIQLENSDKEKKTDKVSR